MTDTTKKASRNFSEIFPPEFQEVIKHHFNGEYIDYRELERYRDFCAVNPTANTREPAHITRQRQAQQEEIANRFTKMIETAGDIDEAHRVIAFMEDCGDPHFAGRLQLKLAEFNRAESEKNRVLQAHLTGRHGEGLSALLEKRGLPPIPATDVLSASSQGAAPSNAQQPNSLNADEDPEREVTGASRELASVGETMNISSDEPEITIDKVEGDTSINPQPAALPNADTQTTASSAPEIHPRQPSMAAETNGSAAPVLPATEQSTNFEQSMENPAVTSAKETITSAVETPVAAQILPQSETVQMTPQPTPISESQTIEEPKGPIPRQNAVGTINNLVGGARRMISGLLGGGEIDSGTASNLHQAMYGAGEEKAK